MIIAFYRDHSNVITIMEIRISKVAAILALLLLVQMNTAKITAQLLILNYAPLFLNLSFSQPTPLPPFQLLFNEIPISYQLVSNTTVPTYFYLMQGNTEDSVNPADYIIQKYVLIFSEPLLVGNGDLDLNSFVLRGHTSKNQTENILMPIGEKDAHFKYQSQEGSMNGLAIAIVSITYFLSLFTVLGINAFHFLVIYVYISIQSYFFTYLDYRMAYYMLFEIHQVTGENDQFIYISIPFIIIGTSFIIGLLSRRFLAALANRSGFWNEMYYLLSYKLFITCWEIFVLPVFINVVHLFQDPDHFTHLPRVISAFYMYFGLILSAIYIYAVLMTMNPQLNESYEHWQKYTENRENYNEHKIDHFRMMDGFHSCIEPKDWKKRNYHLFRAVERVIVMSFIGYEIIIIPNLFFQIIHLIYLFTVRPFKYEFFNYSNIAMQVFVVLFYLYGFIVYMYTNISDEITTSTDINRILLSKIVLLCIIIFSYLLLGIFELYERIKVFKINIDYFNNQNVYIRNRMESVTGSQRGQRSIFNYNNDDVNIKVKKVDRSYVESNNFKKRSASFKRRKTEQLSSPTEHGAMTLKQSEMMRKEEEKSQKSSSRKKSRRERNERKETRKLKEKKSLLHGIVTGDE